MSNKTTTHGATAVDLLTILFVGLKLGHVINWSWWWVLSPLWITLILVVIIIAVVAIIDTW